MAQQAKFAAVAEHLQRRIEGGEYQTGQPLPSEHALADEFGISRLTLRKALELLSEEQLVIRKQGRGAFANPPGRRQVMTTVVYVGETQSHFYPTFYGALCAEDKDRGKTVTAYLPRDDQERSGLAELLNRYRLLICKETEWGRIQPPEAARMKRPLPTPWRFRSALPVAKPSSGAKGSPRSPRLRRRAPLFRWDRTTISTASMAVPTSTSISATAALPPFFMPTAAVRMQTNLLN